MTKIEKIVVGVVISVLLTAMAHIGIQIREKMHPKECSKNCAPPYPALKLPDSLRPSKVMQTPTTDLWCTTHECKG